jgi:hypothetical protein
MQETTPEEQDNETAEADNIRYQVLLAPEESATQVRNSVAGMPGTPLKGMGPGGGTSATISWCKTVKTCRHTGSNDDERTVHTPPITLLFTGTLSLWLSL